MKNSYRIFDLHIFTRRGGGSKNEGTRSLEYSSIWVNKVQFFFRESCTNDLHDCIKIPSIYLNTNCAEYLLVHTFFLLTYTSIQFTKSVVILHF